MADVMVKTLPSAGSGNTRAQMLEAAAKTLAEGPPDTALGIAGSSAAKFVEVARKEYKKAGFTFTDDDIRTIHALLRKRVANTPGLAMQLGHGWKQQQ